MVTVPQLTDREVDGLELVNARRKPFQVCADDIHLDVVKRPSAGGATVRNLAARISAPLGDTYRGEQVGKSSTLGTVSPLIGVPGSANAESANVSVSVHPVGSDRRVTSE